MGRRSSAAALAILLALPASAAAGPGGCDVVGTSGDDVLVADSQHGAVVCGLDGDDVLVGRIGRDVLVGGLGDDRLEGARGADELEGGPGRDLVTYRGSRTRILVDLARGIATGDGRDRLSGIEDVQGSPQDDVLVGSGAGNGMAGLGGRDLIRGGAGPDTLRGRGGADVLSGGGGNDRVLGGPGRDGCTQGLGSGAVRGCEARAFAEAGDILLLEPARRVVGYGFHESLFGTALPLRPLGRITRNDNPGKFRPPPPADGPPYVVMGSRGRPTGATTSTDVVIPSRSRVRSPVTGEVVLVQRYLLYCESPDWKVVIRPQGARSLRVMVLHLARVRVQDGDDVTAAGSILGRAAVNDASSAQENQYFPDGHPHVHIEVERDRAAPTPGCSL